MRTFSKALVVALLLLPAMASAAGFGRLTVQSNIGQPLSAEIDLVSVSPDTAGALTARLAGPDAYQQANLQYNSALSGIKLTIERRADGQYFIRLTGSRPVSEPFIDLLVELSGAGTRLTREYTALLDPPGFTPAPAAPVEVAQARPVIAPVQQAALDSAPAPAAKPIRGAPRESGGKAQEYGPIAKGETLGRIAASLKPEGVSLEQMMVGLYRSNPDAFIRNNMNLVKSGRILRVPDAQELAAIPQGDAVKEYKTQVSDWRAYSGRVADQAGVAPEGGSTTRGRITAKVDDPAAAGGKDVVKLSKGEPGPGGKPLAGGDKARALQEELVARNLELAEARERIAQLEKTIKDTQKLVELKSGGMASAQQKAEAEKGAKPEAKLEPAKPEARKPEAAALAEPAEPKPVPAVPSQDISAPASTQPVAEQKPAPKPVAPPPPPPPPEPELMDVVMDNLPLVGGGLGALLLGGLGLAALRRRRARAASAGDDIEPVMPAMAAGGAAAAAVAATMAADSAPAAEAATDDVDPVQEAEVYMTYGRDVQAVEILKEAMAQNPSREDVQVKLAEVYANRGDAASFSSIAQSLHGLTGGHGDNWSKIAALGYALEPANPLYEAGKDAAPAIAAGETTSTDLDFDLGGDALTTPDIQLEAEPAGQVTEIGGGIQQIAAAVDAGVTPSEPLVPDFNLDAPAASAVPDIVLDVPPVAAPASSEHASIDFNFELPPVETAAAVPAPAAQPAPAADAGLDFKIDMGDLSINLDEPATVAAPPAEKSGHWYDVQQKFDLAKAYQEMGDNEGAREILLEVIKEGDAEQKAEADKLLGSLG